MKELLNILSQYSQIINFAFFTSIIGFLFHLSKIYRTALIDRHFADLSSLKVKIAELESENNNLKSMIDSTYKQNQSEVDILKHQLSYFQRISEMPDDKRAEAIKHEYEYRIKILEERESRRREFENRFSGFSRNVSSRGTAVSSWNLINLYSDFKITTERENFKKATEITNSTDWKEIGSAARKLSELIHLLGW